MVAAVQDASEGPWAWGRQYFFERALAAVEKQILVLRDEEALNEAHMQRALLLYHAGACPPNLRGNIRHTR